MSLQVWLPLNGNTNNQGLLGNLTVSGTPSYTDGKIGQCLSSGANIIMSAEQTAQVLNNTAVSICFWIYINPDNGTGGCTLFGNGSMGESNNRKFTLMAYPTINDLHWTWMNDAANTRFTTGSISGVLPSYTWTHVAVTYQNPNGAIYINGVKVKTFSGVSNSSSFAYSTTALYNNSRVKINDFRLYNNCLSPKEVKEIAKGLMCHYKLSGPPASITSSNPLYTTLGYNDGIEYDCSGYGNNCTKVGNVAYTTDSVRYRSSCSLTGTQYLTFNSPVSSSTTDFSISCWAKFKSESSTETFCTMRTQVGNGIALFKISNNIRFDDNTQTTFSNYTIPVNQWIHVVVTRSSSEKKLYINGELKQTITSVGNMGGISEKGSIGASSAAGSNFGNFTNGYLSDFRIYSTALSASDIKELYNSPISIDKSGNLLAYEFIEE